MNAPRLELTDAPPPGAQEVLVAGLVAESGAALGEPFAARPLAVLLRDPETDAVQGGLLGRTDKGWLFVQFLFLPQACRGAGLGAEVLRRAEAEARERGCHHVWLDTFSFQAPGFYEKQGYHCFGSLPGYPAGHSRHFYFKKLLTEL
jgi:GNAT superfamily N-acetyltransferase